MKRNLPAVASFFVLILLSSLFFKLVKEAPNVWLTQQIKITLAPGQSVDLGRENLGLPKYAQLIEPQHLRITRNNQGQWQFSNISIARQVYVKTDQQISHFLRRWKLNDGDRIQLNDQDIYVKITTANSLSLIDEQNNKASWTNGYLNIPDKFQCHHFDTSWLRWKIQNFSSNKELRLFSLGGQVSCPDSWKLQGLAPKSAIIYWRGGHFWLGKVATGVNEKLFRNDSSTCHQLRDQYTPLTGPEGQIESLVLGRTHYKVRKNPENENQLILEPYKNIPVFWENPTYLSLDTITIGSRDWIGNSEWSMPLNSNLIVWGALIGVGFLFLAWFFELRLLMRYKYLDKKNINLIILMFPSALFIWITMSFNLTLEWGLILCGIAGFWATFQLWREGWLKGSSGGWLWFLALMLAGTGLLTQTQLAAGSADTKWLIYATKQVKMLTLFAAAMGFFALLPLNFWLINFRRLIFYELEWVKWTLLIGITILLVLQLIFGNEQGIYGYQPMELAKFIVVAFVAFVATYIYQMRQKIVIPKQQLWLIISKTILFVLFFILFMLGVHDFSPIIILITVILAYILYIGPSPELNWWIRELIVILALILIILSGYYLHQQPPELLSIIPQEDRLRVWSDPWNYWQSGDQVIQSLYRIYEGGWFVESNWFGPNNGPIVNLPAIQDDFIAAFYIHRFGALSGLGLIIIQLFWCMGLFAISHRLVNEVSPSFLDRRATYWLAMMLFGLGVMQAAHWTISWGNVLGVLPVMGQPMSWLSSGNSHLFALTFPTLIFGLIGARTKLESFT